MSTSKPPPRRLIAGDLNAQPTAQNIDRSTHTRTVPMKVLGLGLSRTGTSSLRQALLDLSYADVYHYASILNDNPRDATLWLRALEAKYPSPSNLHPPKPFTKENWDALLGHCMAITDTPCVIFYRELLSTYPDAKVILTLRDSPRQWWESQMKTIMSLDLSKPVPWWIKPFLPKLTDVDILGREAMERYPMYRVLKRDLRNETREAEEWYEEYVEEIRRLVPEERLLVMNIKDGWKPLCEFLDCEIPPWEFPKVNTGDEFLQNIAVRRKHVEGIVFWNMVKTLGTIAGVGVAVGAWVWRRYV